MSNDDIRIYSAFTAPERCYLPEKKEEKKEEEVYRPSFEYPKYTARQRFLRGFKRAENRSQPQDKDIEGFVAHLNSRTESPSVEFTLFWATVYAKVVEYDNHKLRSVVHIHRFTGEIVKSDSWKEAEKNEGRLRLDNVANLKEALAELKKQEELEAAESEEKAKAA